MNESCCENCKHYAIHYVRTKTGFVKTNCGHCKNPKKAVTGKILKCCKYWERINLEQQEKIIDENIKNEILYMIKKLEAIEELIASKEKNLSTHT